MTIWDELSPHWELFQDGGSTGDIVAAAVADGLHAPLLFVGAGLGTFAAPLVTQLGPVTAVDSSAEMARRALVIHPELRVSTADVCSLPFRDREFKGVFCATGVLEPLPREARATALCELARVNNGQRFFVTAFVRSGGVDLAAIVRGWEARELSYPLLEQLAERLGSRERAAHLFRRALPYIGAALEEGDLIEAAVIARCSVQRITTDLTRGVMLWALQSRRS